MMQSWQRFSSAMLVVTLGSCGWAGPDGPREALSNQQRSGLGAEQAALRVAVVDGGIDTSHPALRDVVVASWRAPDLRAEVSPHATQLAGVVAGRPTEAFSGGLAPGTSLLDAKALNGSGSGNPGDVAAALRWSRAAGADVVLTSLALEVDDPEVRRATDLLLSTGVVVVAASGNAFTDVPMYPASYPGVLSVSAHDRAGHRLQLAGWKHADVAAPGERVWAPTPPATYQAVSGTSVAAAIAVGLLVACGDHRPRSESEIRSHWTNGAVTYGGGALPRLTCPGPDERGGR